MALLVAFVTACAAYHPAPIDPSALAADYQARRLDAPALASLLGRLSGDTLWRPRDLALAALYFRPELGRFRADLREARAGEITAGTRPAAGLSGGVEKAYGGTVVADPWSVSLGLEATLELGGKRGARRQRARARTVEAGLAFQQESWRIALEARGAALAVATAEQELSDARAELDALTRLSALLEARYREGSASRADLAQHHTELVAARLSVATRLRAVREARVTLARALAVPAEQTAGLPLAADSAGSCAVLVPLARDSLQRLALTHRRDLGRSVAAYGVAEADLRLEVARQRPDLTIGPGLFWDAGVNKWTFALGLPALLRRNRGPIAEAVARREGAAADVAVVQDGVLNDVSGALAGCEGAAAEMTAADSVATVAIQRVEVARATYARGETTGTEVAFAELEGVRAVRARHQAARHLLLAGLALEEATGFWRIDPPGAWPDAERPPEGKGDQKR